MSQDKNKKPFKIKNLNGFYFYFYLLIIIKKGQMVKFIFFTVKSI